MRRLFCDGDVSGRRSRRRLGTAGGASRWVKLTGQCRDREAPPSSKPLLDIKEVDDGTWLVSCMHYDLGYFDLELQSLDNPFGARLSPMS